jgi:hypothetical protein
LNGQLLLAADISRPHTQTAAKTVALDKVTVGLEQRVGALESLGPVAAAAGDGLKGGALERIGALERELKAIRADLGGGAARSNATRNGASTARIAELEYEVRDLRAQLKSGESHCIHPLQHTVSRPEWVTGTLASLPHKQLELDLVRSRPGPNPPPTLANLQHEKDATGSTGVDMLADI